MTYIMLQILTSNWFLFIYLFIFPLNKFESWLAVVNTETFWFGVNSLVPAGETEFAKDASFGYKSSNLREVYVVFTSIYVKYLVFVWILNGVKFNFICNFLHLNFSG